MLALALLCFGLKLVLSYDCWLLAALTVAAAAAAAGIVKHSKCFSEIHCMLSRFDPNSPNDVDVAAPTALLLCSAIALAIILFVLFGCNFLLTQNTQQHNADSKRQTCTAQTMADSNSQILQAHLAHPYKKSLIFDHIQ